MFVYFTSKATSSSCRSTEFSCDNKRCIRIGSTCNGVDDCGDYSDERNCSKLNYLIPRLNHSVQILQVVIAYFIICSSIFISKAPCRSFEFSCKNKRCIPKRFVCDGWDDCGDRSDERICCELNWLTRSL